MTSLGADPSLGAGLIDAAEVVTQEELRDALRPPDLPLPFPATVLEAAHRVIDLTSQGRLRAALAISESYAHEPAPLTERVELMRAHAAALRADRRADEARAVLREMVSLMAGAGYRDHALAIVVLHRLARPSAGHGSASSSRGGGRRRLVPPASLSEVEVDEAVLTVVRGLAHPVPSARSHPDACVLEAEEGRMLSALHAFPEAGERILGAPEPLLRLRLAQVLQLQERHEEAVEQALIVLGDLEERERHEGEGDVERSGTAAHAILAASLRDEDPRAAAGHAVTALRAMHDVDDPVRRVDLICELVQDLVLGDLPGHAAYATRRLSSLMRTLPDPSLRVQPLHVIAAERIAAGRPEQAREPLAEAARQARSGRDHRSLLRIHRLAAEGLRREGKAHEALESLRRAAAEARYLSDDLGAGADDRETFLRAELGLRADALRLALGAERPKDAAVEAHEILWRLDRTGGLSVLPREELWEHEVDARVGAMIAAALQESLRPADQVPSKRVAQRARARRAELRDEARRAIAAAPTGVEDRRRYWEVYLEDRDAAMLELLGDRAGALRAAERARDGWAELGEDEHRARVEQQIERLAAEG